MPFDRNQFIEDLKGSYEMYYDLLPEEENGEIPLAFRADFHSRGEKYFLIKPAKIWSNETNEYVFVYSAPWFDREMIDRCVQYALDTALPLIHPHAEHNYSNVHTVFVADTVSEEVRRHIRKVRFSKSYRMNLECNTDSCYCCRCPCHRLCMLRWLAGEAVGRRSQSGDSVPFQL